MPGEAETGHDIEFTVSRNIAVFRGQKVVIQGVPYVVRSFGYNGSQKRVRGKRATITPAEAPEISDYTDLAENVEVDVWISPHAGWCVCLDGRTAERVITPSGVEALACTRCGKWLSVIGPEPQTPADGLSELGRTEVARRMEEARAGAHHLVTGDRDERRRLLRMANDLRENIPDAIATALDAAADQQTGYCISGPSWCNCPHPQPLSEPALVRIDSEMRCQTCRTCNKPAVLHPPPGRQIVMVGERIYLRDSQEPPEAIHPSLPDNAFARWMGERFARAWNDPGLSNRFDLFGNYIANRRQRSLTQSERRFMLRHCGRMEAELRWLVENNPTVRDAWEEAKRGGLSETSAAELAVISLARENEDLRRQLQRTRLVPVLAED